MTASMPERDDEDSSTNGDCSEEEIFWAAQVLAGNLTFMEDDDTSCWSRKPFLMYWWCQPSDEKDERPTKRVKTSKLAEPLNPRWSLEFTKTRIRDTDW